MSISHVLYLTCYLVNPFRLIKICFCVLILLDFLPERDYVTVGSLLSQFRLSVCLSSVTLVHPTQRVEAFGKISSPLCTLAIL